MRRIFYSLITVFIIFSSIHSLADEIDGFNFKNYIYDDEGNPVFIKIYIESPTIKSSSQYKTNALLSSHQDGVQLILNRMTQHDQKGSYIVVPIKKKKDQDDDKDESVWECPYCGTINESYRNTCKKKGCVLYR